MAACSLFEEDEVCHVTPENTYVYGLIRESSETVSSDEEDSEHEVCKRGCVRVAWHPKGKESIDTPENKVLLADRSLMVADIVRRFVPGQETQCGIVQDMQKTCHLHITGTDKYIYNVDSKLLSSCVQLQKFDNGCVTMDNWVGRVEEVTETITLILPDGAKCEVDDSDVCFLDDISEKRPEAATFNEEYWYPGQQLKGLLGNLSNANWLNPTLLFNAKNVDNKRNSTFYAVVDKVEIRSIFVHWICRGYSQVCISPGNKILPPPREIKGADIERLQLVEWFEHCVVNLGDKMYYIIQEDDVLETQLPKHRFVPYAAQHALPQRLVEITHQTEDLYYQRYDESGKHRKKGSRKVGMSSASASSSNSTATTVTSSLSTLSVVTTPECPASVAVATETTEDDAMASAYHLIENKGSGDPAAAADADDEYEDVDDGNDASASDDGSVSSGAKRRRRDKGVGMSVKSLRNACRHARRARPVAEIKLTPGSRVATEVCYTFGLVTVMWQDGTLEEKIPSIDLFPVHHMDELEFFPGSFVISAAAADTSNEYGVVESCNHFERTCQVKWFKPYDAGQSTFPTEVIKDSEMSVYDIHDHPDYKFRPGESVIRVSGFEDAEQTLQAVGQVVRTDPSGTVFVHWSDGSFTSSFPQDLYIVWDMSDYSNSSWESEDSSSSQDDSESDASWETEEEEEGWKIDASDAESEEDEECDALKSMTEKQRSEIKSKMSEIQTFFELVNDLYIALSRTQPDALLSSSVMDTELMACLKVIHKVYHSCRKLDKTLKTGFFSTSQILNLIASIKSDIKNDKSNKIKQHLEHIFESNNKGLLDKSKGHEQKLEVGVSANDSCEGRLESVVSAGSPSKKIKTEDAGSSVDVDMGSSVDCSCASSKKSNSSSVKNSVHTSLRDVEKDISSRLAAANVDENVTALGKASATDVPPTEGNNIAAENASKVAESCKNSLVTVEDVFAAGGEKSEDDEVKQFYTLIETKLESIQEIVDKILASVKGSRRNSVAGNRSRDETNESRSGKSEKHQNGLDLLKSSSCTGKKAENGTEGLGGVPPDTDVDMRADNQEACDVHCYKDQDLSPFHLPVAKEEEEEEDIVDPPGVVLPKGFFMCSTAPDCHSYIAKTCLPSNAKTFNAAVRRELKLLRSSLPDGIIVKGFEDRMDLFSVLIDGPSNTPYEDGMFLFDVMLPHDYPNSPPLFHYLSFSSDRLNPNLYVDGKVCVSLLGTWSGKGMEVWTCKSNLLQVLVSIQGLILVAEPYYNEAGYEKQRGQQIALENSRVYNELALLKLVESMTAICIEPPKPFEQEVKDHLQNNGLRMIQRLRRWLSLTDDLGSRQKLASKSKIAGESVTADSIPNSSTSNETAENCTSSAVGFPEPSVTVSAGRSQVLWKSPPEGHPHFPLLPMSKGFILTLEKSLAQFQSALQTLNEVERLKVDKEPKTDETLEASGNKLEPLS